MNRRHFFPAVAALFSLPLSQRLFAHHGWSSFDETRPLYIAGTVKSMKWQNPHAEIVITMATNATLPADLAKRSVPAQTANVDGAKIFCKCSVAEKTWRLDDRAFANDAHRRMESPGTESR